MDASRISRGKLVLTKKPVDLTRLISEAVDSLSAPLQKKRQAITVNLPPAPLYVTGDPVRLAQVFLNLVSNAIKFTPIEGKITLSVARVENKVEVRVRDSGRGIEPADLGHIFDMFYQAGEESGERAGLGLGLTLVRTLVQMHDGTVDARSAGVGQGSEFVVTLPVAALPEQTDKAPLTSSEANVSAPRRILVVDDNRDAADSLAELLRGLGHEVAVAYDAGGAVDGTSRFRPDTVLLDIGMPLVDGYVAARRIREQPHGAHILLVAMTGWGQPQDKRRTFEAGFDVHLVKPVSLDALLGVFASCPPSASESDDCGCAIAQCSHTSRPDPAS